MRFLSISMMLVGAAIVLVGSTMVPSYLSNERPAIPRPERGQVVAFNNHGKVTYISRHDNLAHNAYVIGGAFISLLGGTLYLRQVPRRRT
ncbi:MAG: hypothetical protein E6Q74_02870 [Pseudoxanthomonas sp.]|nr:MAG: hypothetical protein E6Q74_02870 [Pseudoxanthomonas sp.]